MSQDKEKTAFRRSFFAPILRFFDVFQCLSASRHEPCRPSQVPPPSEVAQDNFKSIIRRTRHGERRKRRPLRGLFFLLSNNHDLLISLRLIRLTHAIMGYGRLIPTLPFSVSALIVSFSSAREPAHKVIVVLVNSR